MGSNYSPATPEHRAHFDDERSPRSEHRFRLRLIARSRIYELFRRVMRDTARRTKNASLECSVNIGAARVLIPRRNRVSLSLSLVQCPRVSHRHPFFHAHRTARRVFRISTAGFVTARRYRAPLFRRVVPFTVAPITARDE